MPRIVASPTSNIWPGSVRIAVASAIDIPPVAVPSVIGPTVWTSALASEHEHAAFGHVERHVDGGSGRLGSFLWHQAGHQVVADGAGVGEVVERRVPAVGLDVVEDAA